MTAVDPAARQRCDAQSAIFPSLACERREGHSGTHRCYLLQPATAIVEVFFWHAVAAEMMPARDNVREVTDEGRPGTKPALDVTRFPRARPGGR
jgi:hypothetical protein